MAEAIAQTTAQRAIDTVRRQRLFREISRSRRENAESVGQANHRRAAENQQNDTAVFASETSLIANHEHQAILADLQATREHLAAMRSRVAETAWQGVDSIIQANEARKQQVSEEIAAKRVHVHHTDAVPVEFTADASLTQELAQKSAHFSWAEGEINTQLKKQSVFSKVFDWAQKERRTPGQAIMKAWDYGLHSLKQKLSSPSRMGPPKAA